MLHTFLYSTLLYFTLLYSILLYSILLYSTRCSSMTIKSNLWLDWTSCQGNWFSRVFQGTYYWNILIFLRLDNIQGLSRQPSQLAPPNALQALANSMVLHVNISASFKALGDKNWKTCLIFVCFFMAQKEHLNIFNTTQTKPQLF